MKGPQEPQSPKPGGKTLSCVLACSGCSAAGELADLTARRLQALGVARMSCLAGVGGRVKSILATIQKAPGILMIDGCPLECGANTLRLAGVSGFQHLKLHDLGVRKHQSEVCDETVQALAGYATALLSGAPLRLRAELQASLENLDLNQSHQRKPDSLSDQ